MNRDVKRILVKIFFDIIFLVFVIFVFSFFSKDTANARERMLDVQENISIDVVSRGDSVSLLSMSDEEAYIYSDSIILEVTNNTTEVIDYNLLLKINIFDNLENYKILFLGKIYSLDELEYYDVDEYRYFILGSYTIGNKSQNFTFLLWKSDGTTNYDDINIKYSFVIEEG